MYEHKDMFDLSDIDAENPLIGKFKDSTNKKAIGVFKPEHVNFNINEFIGLRSKMYSLLLENGSEKKTAKGVVRSIMSKELKHRTYKNILESNGKMYSNMKVIRSSKHQLYTMEINKVSLSAYDDKRWSRDDGVSSYVYGNCKVLK